MRTNFTLQACPNVPTANSRIFRFSLFTQNFMLIISLSFKVSKVNFYEESIGVTLFAIRVHV